VVAEKVALVAEAAAGRDIELNIRALMVRVTDDPAGEIGTIASSLAVPDAMVAESPFALIGSPASIADTLRQRRDELGLSYVIVGDDDIEAFGPVVATLAGT
jgi:hypothetical protein